MKPVTDQNTVAQIYRHSHANCDQGRGASYFDIQFLCQFSGQTLQLSFPCFDLATGELPQTPLDGDEPVVEKSKYPVFRNHHKSHPPPLE